MAPGGPPPGFQYQRLALKSRTSYEALSKANAPLASRYFMGETRRVTGKQPKQRGGVGKVGFDRNRLALVAARKGKKV